MTRGGGGGVLGGSVQQPRPPSLPGQGSLLSPVRAVLGGRGPLAVMLSGACVTYCIMLVTGLCLISLSRLPPGKLGPAQPTSVLHYCAVMRLAAI
jgi:hypothetical protein